MRPLTRDDLPLQLVDMYNTYSWAGVDTSPAFAYDSVGEWRAMSSTIMDRTYAVIGALDPRLRAQEREFVDKMQVCWRLPGYGMLHEPDATAYSASNAEQARTLTPHFRKLAQAYIAYMHSLSDATLAGYVNDGPVKLDRGKGAPYWSPRTDRAVTVAYARLAQGVTTHEELQNRVMAAGAARLPFVQTSYVRIDRSRKPLPRFIPLDGRLHQMGERMAPKVRRIGAMPFAVNHLWAGVGNLLRTVMAEMDDRNTGTLEPSILAARGFRYSVAIDLAGYDTTVAIETLDAFRDVFLRVVLYYLASRGILDSAFVALLLDCDYHFQRYEILVPPWLTSEVARLIPAAGQIRSGENLTSFKGTLINRCRIDAKAEALAQGQVPYKAFNYGDDSLLLTDSASLVDGWAENDTFGGFVETIAPDATFLMRRIPYNYGYLGRLIGACVNRESHQEPDSLMAAAGSFATRYELLSGHPAQQDFYPILRSWGMSEKWTDAIGIAQGADAVSLVQTAAMMTLAFKDIRSVDAEVDQLAALAATGRSQASNALDWIVDALRRQQRQVSWSELQAAASDMTLADAEREIKRRSYTIRNN